MSFWDLFFWSIRGPGTPADQKTPDHRGDEANGIVDGQLLNTTELDPDIQDKLKEFPNAK